MTTLNSESACHWLFFAEDWRQPASDAAAYGRCRSALGAHSEAMAGLIDTQQEVASQLTEHRHLKPARQFLANFKLHNWQPLNLDLQTTPTPDGLDYLFSTCKLPCFKGNFSSIWAPDSGGIHGAPRTSLDAAMTLYKLEQFKTLFPHVSYFWIFLAALTCGHLLWSQYSSLPAGSITADPQLLHFKTQFDPQPIEDAFRSIGGASLAYSVSRFNAGRYESLTLGVYAASTLLMRTELSLLKVRQTGTVDIVLH